MGSVGFPSRSARGGLSPGGHRSHDWLFPEGPCHVAQALADRLRPLRAGRRGRSGAIHAAEVRSAGRSQETVVRRDLGGAQVPGRRSSRHLGPHRGHCRRSHAAVALVRGVGVGRRVEDRERRDVVDTHLRRPGRLLDWLRRPRPEEPLYRVGRHGREQQPARPRLRRRHLQIARRRQDLGSHGAGALRAHLEDHRAPGRLEHGVRGRDRPGMGGGRRPWRVQDDRRRQDLEGRARDQRAHRRRRPRDGPARPQRPHRRRSPAPPPRLDLHQRRPRVGHLQEHRRWRLHGARSPPASRPATPAASASPFRP